LNSALNFISRSNHSLNLGLWFDQVFHTIKLIWFSIFYLNICICRNSLKLRLDCYVAIAKFINNSKWFCYTVLIWFVSKSEKQIEVSFIEISKLGFMACCALSFKFVHNGNYSNYYEICKHDYLFQIKDILCCLNYFYRHINSILMQKRIEVFLPTSSFSIRWLRFSFQNGYFLKRYI